MNSSQVRSEWLKLPPSQLRTNALQMCDDYDKAMRTIVLNKRQAKQALQGKPITGKFQTYGELSAPPKVSNVGDDKEKYEQLIQRHGL